MTEELNQDHILQIKYPDVPSNKNDWSELMNSQMYLPNLESALNNPNPEAKIKALEIMLDGACAEIERLKAENKELKEALFLHHKSLPTFY